MNTSSTFKEGQRWISESEPELGLGTLIQLTAERIQILFPASGETRMYARDNAPLKRVRFRIGDAIQDHEDQQHVVESVQEKDGLITYQGKGWELPEAQLSDRISFHRPEDRLLGGQIDEVADFHLRRRALENLHHARKSEVRGFVGGRIDLIPHQLYIAHEVSVRHAPRVLLSDEVGLGKTIEACLILHRLLLSGRAARVLILVPESLVHQWFVEMLRRFNVWLNIFDEERCAAIQQTQPDANPFLDDQLILSDLEFLARSPDRAAQAVEAGWDMLVVDEAHHLEWAPEAVSVEYETVETLSRNAEGLLLLTATPEQLGPQSHFARLRLLDPDRYGDFDAFTAAATDYKAIADVAAKLQDGKPVGKKDAAFLKKRFAGGKRDLDGCLGAIARWDAAARRSLLDDLLDLHGPGRVMFRNTRATMSGFPKRKALLAPLRAARSHEEQVERVSMEFAEDAGEATMGLEIDLSADPRVTWLAELLQKLGSEKVLLICRRREKAEALDRALRSIININTGIFHEGLTLVQRDRNAAWFADEEGSRLLICSEIGSEGRNFQFAHHLVLFDLPLNPELLEQRIGRLDRIGQTRDIQIHAPYLEGSPHEVLCRWYHEGLNAFETSLEGGNELFREFGRQVHDLALEFPAADSREAQKELSALLKATRERRAALLKQLEEGRDRLLEMHSFRPDTAETLVNAIRTEDQRDVLEEFMLDVFEHFGVHAEELGPRTYQLNAQGVITDAFPSIPEEGMIATFDRKRALGREDVGFLTWDHPMVTGAIDLVLGSEKGNSCFSVWPDPEDRTLILETMFVLETVAKQQLHVDRFLPATPLRFFVNHGAKDITSDLEDGTFESGLRKGDPYPLLDNPDLTGTILPAMIQSAQRSAEKQRERIVASSLEAMNQMLDHEIKRLKHLQSLNSHVRSHEIELAREQQQALEIAIQGARLRLDSVRLIWKGPMHSLNGK